jgi:hypothetical protein
MKNRHSVEQIIRILGEIERGGLKVSDACRPHGISEQTYYPLAQQVCRDGDQRGPAPEGAGDRERPGSRSWWPIRPGLSLRRNTSRPNEVWSYDLTRTARLMAARCASCRLSTNTRGNACCSKPPAASRPEESSTPWKRVMVCNGRKPRRWSPSPREIPSDGLGANWFRQSTGTVEGG